MWVEKHGKTFRIRDRSMGKLVTLEDGYPNQTMADNALIQLQSDELRGDALVPRGGQITLDQFIDSWWPSYERSLKPTSRHSEGGRVRNHIRPLLGGLCLDDVDSPIVQQWVDVLGEGVEHKDSTPDAVKWIRKPLAPKTVANCHAVLYVIMTAAVAARRIRLNPCAATKLPLRVHHEMKFLTDPEIARLIAALPEHWRPLIMLLVGTGLRWGEAVGLRVGRVDLLAKTPKVLVVEHLHELSSTGEIVFTDPKSRMSRRTVSITAQVALELVGLVAGKQSNELMFTAPKGGPVRTRNFRRIWVKARDAAGLPGLRVHDLRHTHAAILIAANRQMSAISRRLGHSSIAVTDTLYGHLREEIDEGILSAISDAMAQVDPADLAAEVDAELADLT